MQQGSFSLFNFYTMTKLKLALIALTALAGIGGATASTHRSSEIRYNPQGEQVNLADKDQPHGWTCQSAPTNCTYPDAALQHPAPDGLNQRFVQLQ